MSLPSPHAGDAPLGYGAIIRIKEFAIFWTSQMVSAIGDRLDQVAVMALALRSSTIPDADKSDFTNKVFLFAILPYVLVTPLTAGISDRLDRRKVMLTTHIYQGCVVSLAALAYATNQAPWVYHLCVFLSGCGTAVFGPCKLAFIPQVVPANGLVRANSMTSMTGSIGTTLGTLVGGWFVVWMAGERLVGESLEALTPTALLAYEAKATSAAKALLWVDVATFVVSAALLSIIAMPKGNLPHYLNAKVKEAGGEKNLDPELAGLVKAASARSRKPYFQDLVDAVRYCASHALGRAQLALTCVLWFIIGVAYPSLNTVAIDLFKGSEATLAQVSGAVGVAMFAGGLLIGLGQRYFKPRKVLTGAFLLLSALAPLPILSASINQLMLLCAPIGMICGAIIISIDSLYQLGVPNRLRGRVFALNYIVLNLLLVLGILAESNLKGVARGMAIGDDAAMALMKPAELEAAIAQCAAYPFFLVSALGLVGAAMTWFGAAKWGKKRG